MHLRPDRPARGARLGRWVDRLEAADRLILAGDVCDFWFASRGRLEGEPPCAGLRALAGFRRRGGGLVVLPGNHDAWLGDYYRRALGAELAEGPTLELEAEGLRVHVVHGHLLGARPAWKGWMEGRAFFRGFRAAPEPIARALAGVLDRFNDATNDADNERHLEVYRRYAEGLAGRADVVVFGHTHLTVDEADRRPRVVVLGDWKERASYLRIDGGGARQIVEEDGVVAGQ